MGRRNVAKPFTCVSCEIEIAGRPTFHVGLPFCCAGCVAGGPCTCSYDGRSGVSRVRHCHDIEGVRGTDVAGPVREMVGARRD